MTIQRSYLFLLSMILALVLAACRSGGDAGDGGDGDHPDAAIDAGGEVTDADDASDDGGGGEDSYNGCGALFAPPEERVLEDEEGREWHVFDWHLLCTLDYEDIHAHMYMIVEQTRVSLYTNGSDWEARRAWVCREGEVEELAGDMFYLDYTHHSIFEMGVGFEGYHFRYGHGELCSDGSESCKFFDIFNVYDQDDHFLKARFQPAVCVFLSQNAIPRPLVFQVRVPSEGEEVVYGMGSEQGEPDEQPAHEVTVRGQFVDVREATNSDFSLFLADQGNDCSGQPCFDTSGEGARLHEEAGAWTPEAGYEDHPVVGVTWHGANAYCRWRRYFLPTEAQWEMAASAAGARDYPWGDRAPDCDTALFDACGSTGPDPVCSRVAGHGREGVCDLSGNVSEWVKDWYQFDFYANCPGDCRFPSGPESDTGLKVVRGGSFRDPASGLRAVSRDCADPSVPSDDIGVRCVIRGGTPNPNY